MILPNGGVADKTGGEQDLMCRLQNTLQVGGEALGEGELFGDAVETNAPCDVPLLAGDLEQPVQTSRDR